MTEHISVVIPNWNGADMLPICLDSLARQSYRDFRVYVVDNGSEDDSRALMERDYPWVEIIAHNSNLGFAGGMNSGFAVAEGALLVALNNDVEAHPDWLAKIAAAFEADPDLGLAASQLMDYRERDRIDSLGDSFSLYGLSSKLGAGRRITSPPLPAFDILSPCAAASVHRRDVLDAIGGYDPEFFAYMEDIDLGLRGFLAGYSCRLVPDAIVYHMGSATSGGTASAFSIRMTVSNTYAMTLKTMPLALVPVVLTVTAAMHGTALAASFLPGKLTWLKPHRGALLAGLGRAFRMAPAQLAKRRSFAPLRRRGAWALLRAMATSRKQARILRSMTKK